MAARHGVTGARGEALLGFPSVFGIALPGLRNALARGARYRAKRCCMLFLCYWRRLQIPMSCFAAGRKNCRFIQTQAGEFLERVAACSSPAGRKGRKPCTVTARQGICRREAVPICLPRPGSCTSCNQKSAVMSLAILCSGQGAQYPAMLDMVADYPAADEVINAGEAELGMSCAMYSRSATRCSATRSRNR